MAKAQRKRTASSPTPSAASYSTIEEVQPRTATAPHVSLRAPMFVFITHPRAWQVKGAKILPDLSKRPLKSGVGGAFYHRNAKRWDLSAMRSNLSRSGKYTIPLAVDAPTHESYVVQPWPGYHTDRWTTMYEGSDMATRDDEAWDLWRESLVQRGVVKPPGYGTLRQMAEQRKRVLIRLQSQSAATHREMPDLQARIKRIEEEIKTVEAALEKVDKPDPGLAKLPATAATVEGL